MLRFHNAILFCSMMSLSFSLYAFKHEPQKSISNNIIEKEYEKNETINKISKLNKELKSKKINSKEYKSISDQRSKLLVKKWEIVKDLKDQLSFNHKHRFSLKSKLNLKITPNASCESPCVVTIKVNTDIKLKNKITKYIFKIDDKTIESSTPVLTTTLYFSKNLINKTNNPKSHAINIKFFRIQAFAETKNDLSIASNIKRIAVKESKTTLAVDLLTPSLMPMDQIQIASNQFKTLELKAQLNNLEIIFRKLNNDINSNIMIARMPYIEKENVTLKVLNSEFQIKILPLPKVENPSTYIQEYMNNTLEIVDVFSANEKYRDAIGIKGIDIFNKLKGPVVLFNKFIQTYATPDEIQVVANLMNASILFDDNLKDLVTVSKSNQDVFTSMTKKDKTLLVSKLISILSAFAISSSHAQDTPLSPRELLIADYTGMMQAALQEVLTIGVKVMFDEMLHKCYLSHAIQPPKDVKLAEDAINATLTASATMLVIAATDPTMIGGSMAVLGAATAYVSALMSSGALIVRIGLDCEVGRFIVPVLDIKNQPAIAPITPGEVLNYNLKCNVGEERYYDPREILIKTDSFFEYNAPVFSPMITEDKLLTGCSGLGRFSLSDSKDFHDVNCRSNILENTRAYQLNLDSYTTFHKESCQGNNDYEVGVNYFETPILSCSFINTTNSIEIPSKEITGNQLEFNLTKKWTCPKAEFETSTEYFDAAFDAVDVTTDTEEFRYIWTLGDGTKTAPLTSPYFFYTYKTIGRYSVTLTIIDSSNVVRDSSTQEIEILPKTDSFFLDLDGRGTFLPTGPEDRFVIEQPGEDLVLLPYNPSPLNLTQLYNNEYMNLRPGDFIYLKTVGDFKSSFEGTDAQEGALGIFVNASGTHLKPGADSDDVNGPVPQSFTVANGGFIKLRIPAGATGILFSALDTIFADNSDPDGDYGVIVKFDIVRTSDSN